MDTYDFIYLLTNIFGTYTIYKFMHIFFDHNEINKRVELASYISYFLLIGAVHIVFEIPIINVFSNLILFFLLTGMYSLTWKLRFIAVVYIYAILISVETITIIMFSIVDLNPLMDGIDIELILSLTISKILSYIVVLVISNFKMLKARINISPLHWFAVVSIPLGTLFTTFMLMIESNKNNFVQIFISIAILFLINIFVFYLYDVLLQSYQEKMERNLLKQQNNAYIKQLKIINQSQENFKIIRHDIKLHISALQALIEKNNNALALDYIQTTYNLINYSNEYAKSGNAEVDSILNYKIHEAKKQGIEVNLNLHIPEKLNIQPIDFIIVLGNLLDNAIEATSKLKEDKKIEASIELDRNVLYVSVINSFQGELLYKDNKLITTHKDKESHGLGLNSVRKSTEKYNGTMNINHTDKIFCIDVLLYNPDNFILKEEL